MPTTTARRQLINAQQAAAQAMSRAVTNAAALDMDERASLIEEVLWALDQVSPHLCTSYCSDPKWCSSFWKRSDAGKLSILIFGDNTYFVHNSTVKALENARLYDFYDIFDEAFPY